MWVHSIVSALFGPVFENYEYKMNRIFIVRSSDRIIVEEFEHRSDRLGAVEKKKLIKEDLRALSLEEFETKYELNSVLLQIRKK